MTKYIIAALAIWDASARDRTTRMPLFGRYKILTEQEIDLVVDYVLTL
jgi:mono/diheme cytochrome c family protein